VNVISFRPLTRDDLPLLARWQAQPHVARWWREDAEPAVVTARYLPCLEGQDSTKLFVTTFERYPEADTALVAVGQRNVASWRALEKAGYRRCWAGELISDDPSDEGPMYLYRRNRPPAF